MERKQQRKQYEEYMTTVVDADALIGLTDTNDAHHIAATRFVQELENRNARVVLLPTALAEFATIVPDKIGLERTNRAVHLLLQNYSLMEVNTQLFTRAIAIYNKQTSKKNTLFDCYVMGAAAELETDCIFSFDAGYTKNGFTLIKDFLER